MINATVAPLAPESRARVIAIADRITSRPLETGEADLIRGDVLAFFDSALAEENRTHRNTQRRIRLMVLGIILFFSLLLAFALGFSFWWRARHPGKPGMPVPVGAFAGLLPMFVLSLNRQAEHLKNRRAGLNLLLNQYAKIEHTGIIIDCLSLSDDKTPLQQRLTEFLPLYHRTDVPPLEPARVQALLRELKDEVTHLDQGKWRLTEERAAYLTALVHFLEREVAKGREIGQAISPVLEHLSASSYAAPLRYWEPVRTAAEDCLVQIKGSTEA